MGLSVGQKKHLRKSLSVLNIFTIFWLITGWNQQINLFIIRFFYLVKWKRILKNVHFCPFKVQQGVSTNIVINQAFVNKCILLEIILVTTNGFSITCWGIIQNFSPMANLSSYLKRTWLDSLLKSHPLAIA